MTTHRESNDGMNRAELHVPAPLAHVSDFLERQPRSVVWLVCVLTLAAVFVVDIVTGPDIALSVFYLIPVSIAAWHLGWQPALLMIASSGISWLLADQLAGRVYAFASVRYWNAGVRTLFFFVVGYILTLLKQALRHERELARTDSLTGLANSRSFHELGAREVGRAHRLKRPITLAFIDVDGFKLINDTQGHAAGDNLLRQIAQMLREETRDIDVVARLGGDEFALLLPDVGPIGAHVAAERILQRLHEAAARIDAAAGFSIGVVTANHPSVSLTGLMRQADHLMYEAKRDGGHRVIYLDETAGLDRVSP